MIPSASPYTLNGVNHTYYNNISYGGLNKETMNIFTPNDATGPTPVVIDIHGGGFTGGNKDSRMESNVEVIEQLIGANIAYVTIGYRLNKEFNEKKGILACIKSASRAIQFIRFNSGILNIDKEKLGLMGGSAGSGVSMWLAYNLDQADPSSADPLLRESTLAKSISLNVPQATYDLIKWGSDVFERTEGYDVQERYETFPEDKKGVDRAYGTSTFEELLREPTISLRRELDMLRLIEDYAVDVETQIFNSNQLDDVYTSNGVLKDELHNVRHVEEIEKALTAKGLPSVISCPALGFNDNETIGEFFIRTLKQQ